MRQVKPSSIKVKTVSSTNSQLLSKFALSWGRKGIPTSEEKKQNGIVTWGKKNNYHELYYKAYNESAIHKNLIDGKVRYLISGGLQIEDGDEAEFEEFKKSINKDGIFKECLRDYELLDMIALRVQINLNRTKIKFQHYDAGKMRMGLDGRFHYKNDWGNISEKVQIFKPYDPNDTNQYDFMIWYRSKGKSSDDKTDLGIYPKPSYAGGMNDIISSIQISKFRMYETFNGYKGGNIVIVPKPATEEEEDEIVQNIKDGAANVDGKGFITVIFTSNNENVPKIETLTGNDLHTRYLTTEEGVINNIFVAHGITSPALFGIKTPGQLGATQELATSFSIFVNTYVEERKQVPEELLNFIWSDVLKKKGRILMLNPNEIFKSDETLSDKIAGLPPVAQGAVIQSLSANELREMVGLPPVAGGDSINQTDDPTDFILNLFAASGRDKSMFEVISSISIPHDTTPDIIDIMEKHILKKTFSLHKKEAAVLDVVNAGTTDADEISKITGIKKTEVVDILKRLIDTGQITPEIKPVVEVPETKFEVVYDYRLRPDAPPLKPGGTSRPFCTKLVAMNRFWTREEIDAISAALAAQGVKRGFDQYPDVWRYRGGWYHDYTTGKNRPSCRHEWAQTVVIRKK